MQYNDNMISDFIMVVALNRDDIGSRDEPELDTWLKLAFKAYVHYF